MKRMLVTAMAVVIATTIIYGQEEINALKKAQFAKAVTGYKIALKSENLGVRQSALYQLARMKSRYPDTDFSELMRSLDRLSKKDLEPIVRVQANLIAVYIADEKLAQKIKAEPTDDPTIFYNRVQTELALAAQLK